MKFLTSLLAFFFFQSVHASTFIPTNEEDKIAQSDRICAVTVVDIKSERVGGPKGIIWTVAIVKPFECYKGETQDEFEITWPGGRLGRNASEVPGAPKMAIGEKHLLFLTKDETSPRYLIHSWLAGMSPLVEDKKNKTFTRQKHSTYTVQRGINAGKGQPAESPTETLVEFRARVNKVLGNSN